MSIYLSTLTLPGTRPEGTNPLPRFRRETGFGFHTPKGEFPPEVAADIGSCTRTLPYRLQGRYSRELRPVTLKTVVLENRYLKATFVPEFGGKLWSLFDKVQGRELLMANPVLRPASLGILDAWTSGGIEWNFGSLGHTYFTCADVFAAILTAGDTADGDPNADGSRFLRIYEFERAKECIWQADFHLPEESRQLYSHVKLINPGDDDTTTYWWSNIAIPEDGSTRVLASSQDVVVFCPGGALSYEHLPYLSVMPGDLSYPVNATRSFDYFFQPEGSEKTAWESGVNKSGVAFYDRSTAPLIYHKMFCWGNHMAGHHWQDFLSEPGKGDYIEIQAGIAPSQAHDKLFPAHSCFEWTQCYGGIQLDAQKVHGVSLEAANAYMGAVVDQLIPEAELLAADARFRKAADVNFTAAELVHVASGWGALELEREACEAAADGRTSRTLPASVLFPADTLGPEQEPWLGLLRDGILAALSPDTIPVSWLTSEAWLKLLEASLERPGGRNWFSLLHYGNMLFEYWDNAHTAAVAAAWPETLQREYELRAEAAWKESDALVPNVWAKRNLAILEDLRGNSAAAEQYYDALFALPASRLDFAFTAEYMGWLNHAGKFEKAWALFESMPAEIRAADRVTLCAARAAVKLNKLDYARNVLEQEHSVIREGETSLTDLWFEAEAKRIGLERGLRPEDLTGEILAALIEEAEASCPPPHAIDFRMSYDKKNKYRVTG